MHLAFRRPQLLKAVINALTANNPDLADPIESHLLFFCAPGNQKKYNDLELENDVKVGFTDGPDGLEPYLGIEQLSETNPTGKFREWWSIRLMDNGAGKFPIKEKSAGKQLDFGEQLCEVQGSLDLEQMFPQEAMLTLLPFAFNLGGDCQVSLDDVELDLVSVVRRLTGLWWEALHPAVILQKLRVKQ